MKIATQIALGLFLGASLLQACGGDDDDDNDRDGSGDVRPPVDDDSSDVGGGGPDGDGDGDGGDDGPIIEEPDRPKCPTQADGEQPAGSPIAGEPCWNIQECNATQLQHLQQCSSNCIGKFDNQNRIENFTGTLPPL